MKKQLFLITLLALFISATTTFAQSNQRLNASENNSDNQTMRKMYAGLGLTYQTFQDRKYSDVNYAGVGLGLQFGASRYNNEQIWDWGFAGGANLFSGNTNSRTGFSGNGTFYVQHQRFITENIAVGGRLDALDFHLRKASDLANNSIYYLVGHHVYASGVYKSALSDKVTLQAGLDIGLFSFMQEGTGFAFSTPQNALEDGAFNYQDEALGNPLGYKFYQFEPLWKHVNLRTNIELQYKKRLTFAYQWHARNYTQLKGYGVTTGTHNFVLRINLVHKAKG